MRTFLDDIVSLLSDYFGTPHIMANTINGKEIPIAIIILGVGVKSFKKQIMRPNTAKAPIAIVPVPTPRTRPSYISRFPDEGLPLTKILADEELVSCEEVTLTKVSRITERTIYILRLTIFFIGCSLWHFMFVLNIIQFLILFM